MFKKILVVFILFVALGTAGYLAVCNWAYSEGSRTGYLIKVSKKGYLFKTYEGQLNLGGFATNDDQALIGNIWNFSMEDEALYRKVESMDGKKVTIWYREIIKAMPWQGKTNYFVTDIRAKE